MTTKNSTKNKGYEETPEKKKKFGNAKGNY